MQDVREESAERESSVRNGIPRSDTKEYIDKLDSNKLCMLMLNEMSNPYIHGHNDEDEIRALVHRRMNYLFEGCVDVPIKEKKDTEEYKMLLDQYDKHLKTVRQTYHSTPTSRAARASAILC